MAFRVRNAENLLTSTVLSYSWSKQSVLPKWSPTQCMQKGSAQFLLGFALKDCFFDFWWFVWNVFWCVFDMLVFLWDVWYIKNNPERSPYVFMVFATGRGCFKVVSQNSQGDSFQKHVKHWVWPPNQLTSVENRFPRCPPYRNVARILNFALKTTQNLKI